jgi:glycine cleavage system H protein
VSEYNLPEQCRYTREDEWVLDSGEDRYLVGITDYARQQLGDIVFVELPDVGTALEAGTAYGVIESVKAVSDLLSPIAGSVIEVNDNVEETPEVLSDESYGENWLIAIRPNADDPMADLLTAAQYQAFIDERE